jgi:hypothetical protein
MKLTRMNTKVIEAFYKEMFRYAGSRTHICKTTICRDIFALLTELLGQLAGIEKIRITTLV